MSMIPLNRKIIKFKYTHNNLLTKPQINIDYERLKEQILPMKYAISLEWKLAYSTSKDGFSKKMFHFCLKKFTPPFLFVIEDVNCNVFGCLLDRDVVVQKSCFGSSQCFLFKMVHRKDFLPKDIGRPYLEYLRINEAYFLRQIEMAKKHALSGVESGNQVHLGSDQSDSCVRDMAVGNSDCLKFQKQSDQSDKSGKEADSGRDLAVKNSDCLKFQKQSAQSDKSVKEADSGRDSAVKNSDCLKFQKQSNDSVKEADSGQDIFGKENVMIFDSKNCHRDPFSHLNNDLPGKELITESQFCHRDPFTHFNNDLPDKESITKSQFCHRDPFTHFNNDSPNQVKATVAENHGKNIWDSNSSKSKLSNYSQKQPEPECSLHPQPIKKEIIPKEICETETLISKAPSILSKIKNSLLSFKNNTNSKSGFCNSDCDSFIAKSHFSSFDLVMNHVHSISKDSGKATAASQSLLESKSNVYDKCNCPDSNDSIVKNTLSNENKCNCPDPNDRIPKTTVSNKNKCNCLDLNDHKCNYPVSNDRILKTTDSNENKCNCLDSNDHKCNYPVSNDSIVKTTNSNKDECNCPDPNEDKCNYLVSNDGIPKTTDSNENKCSCLDSEPELGRSSCLDKICKQDINSSRKLNKSSHSERLSKKYSISSSLERAGDDKRSYSCSCYYVWGDGDCDCPTNQVFSLKRDLNCLSSKKNSRTLKRYSSRNKIPEQKYARLEIKNTNDLSRSTLKSHSEQTELDISFLPTNSSSSQIDIEGVPKTAQYTFSDTKMPCTRVCSGITTRFFNKSLFGTFFRSIFCPQYFNDLSNNRKNSVPEDYAYANDDFTSNSDIFNVRKNRHSKDYAHANSDFTSDSDIFNVRKNRHSKDNAYANSDFTSNSDIFNVRKNSVPKDCAYANSDFTSNSNILNDSFSVQRNVICQKNGTLVRKSKERVFGSLNNESSFCDLLDDNKKSLKSYKRTNQKVSSKCTKHNREYSSLSLKDDERQISKLSLKDDGSEHPSYPTNQKSRSLLSKGNKKIASSLLSLSERMAKNRFSGNLLCINDTNVVQFNDTTKNPITYDIRQIYHFLTIRRQSLFANEEYSGSKQSKTNTSNQRTCSNLDNRGTCGNSDNRDTCRNSGNQSTCSNLGTSSNSGAQNYPIKSGTEQIFERLKQIHKRTIYDKSNLTHQIHKEKYISTISNAVLPNRSSFELNLDNKNMITTKHLKTIQTKIQQEESHDIYCFNEYSEPREDLVNQYSKSRCDLDTQHSKPREKFLNQYFEPRSDFNQHSKPVSGSNENKYSKPREYFMNQNSKQVSGLNQNQHVKPREDTFYCIPFPLDQNLSNNLLQKREFKLPMNIVVRNHWERKALSFLSNNIAFKNAFFQVLCDDSLLMLFFNYKSFFMCSLDEYNYLAKFGYICNCKCDDLFRINYDSKREDVNFASKEFPRNNHETHNSKSEPFSDEHIYEMRDDRISSISGSKSSRSKSKPFSDEFENEKTFQNSGSKGPRSKSKPFSDEFEKEKTFQNSGSKSTCNESKNSGSESEYRSECRSSMHGANKPFIQGSDSNENQNQVYPNQNEEYPFNIHETECLYSINEQLKLLSHHAKVNHKVKKHIKKQTKYKDLSKADMKRLKTNITNTINKDSDSEEDYSKKSTQRRLIQRISDQVWVNNEFLIDPRFEGLYHFLDQKQYSQNTQYRSYTHSHQVYNESEYSDCTIVSKPQGLKGASKDIYFNSSFKLDFQKDKISQSNQYSVDEPIGFSRNSDTQEANISQLNHNYMNEQRDSPGVSSAQEANIFQSDRNSVNPCLSMNDHKDSLGILDTNKANISESDQNSVNPCLSMNDQKDSLGILDTNKASISQSDQNSVNPCLSMNEQRDSSGISNAQEANISQSDRNSVNPCLSINDQKDSPGILDTNKASISQSDQNSVNPCLSIYDQRGFSKNLPQYESDRIFNIETHKANIDLFDQDNSNEENTINNLYLECMSNDSLRRNYNCIPASLMKRDTKNSDNETKPLLSDKTTKNEGSKPTNASLNDSNDETEPLLGDKTTKAEGSKPTNASFCNPKILTCFENEPYQSRNEKKITKRENSSISFKESTNEDLISEHQKMNNCEKELLKCQSTENDKNSHSVINPRNLLESKTKVFTPFDSHSTSEAFEEKPLDLKETKNHTLYDAHYNFEAFEEKPLDLEKTKEFTSHDAHSKSETFKEKPLDLEKPKEPALSDAQSNSETYNKKLLDLEKPKEPAFYDKISLKKCTYEFSKYGKIIGKDILDSTTLTVNQKLSIFIALGCKNISEVDFRLFIANYYKPNSFIRNNNGNYLFNYIQKDNIDTYRMKEYICEDTDLKASCGVFISDTTDLNFVVDKVYARFCLQQGPLSKKFCVFGGNKCENVIGRLLNEKFDAIKRIALENQENGQSGNKKAFDMERNDSFRFSQNDTSEDQDFKNQENVHFDSQKAFDPKTSNTTKQSQNLDLKDGSNGHFDSRKAFDPKTSKNEEKIFNHSKEPPQTSKQKNINNQTALIKTMGNNIPFTPTNNNKPSKITIINDTKSSKTPTEPNTEIKMFLDDDDSQNNIISENHLDNYFFRKFPATKKNNYYCWCTNNYLAFGCSDGKFGLILDSTMSKGETYEVETYDNEVLTDSNHFVVKRMEVWSITP